MSAGPKPRALSFVTFLCRRNAKLGGSVNNAGFISAERGARMSSMVELVLAAVALASACIFLAHAIEAYRAH
jgi:hypothetical protein